MAFKIKETTKAKVSVRERERGNESIVKHTFDCAIVTLYGIADKPD